MSNKEQRVKGWAGDKQSDRAGSALNEQGGGVGGDLGFASESFGMVWLISTLGGEKGADLVPLVINQQTFQ